jgi:cell division protein FtsI/penicillin-binding protein 2
MPLDPNKMDELPYIPNGSSLILTIDREIQASMEELLDDAIDLNGAAGGVIAVMDPETGEILAMASQPRLDINRFWEYEDVFPKKVPFNRAVSEDYEPGSVFKVLTMAAALDSNSVKPDTQFLDTGMIEVGGVFIYNWNRGVWGWQDMTGCLQHSLNVCLAWVATQIGASRFYEYMQKFGLGHITGIDLAGEVPGRLKLPGDSDWYEADLGTNAFGQGISVTPVQMLMALSAIANDGEMVVPHVLKAMVTEGRQYVTPNPVVGRPISAKTAHVLNEMLATSLEVESSNALVEGYRVAGKTGTAEIATPEGYTSELTNASFAGWGPVDDPRFIVYVWLEKPTSSPWGSVVAAPIFKQAVERLVILMNIPPDDVRIQMSKH